MVLYVSRGRQAVAGEGCRPQTTASSKGVPFLYRCGSCIQRRPQLYQEDIVELVDDPGTLGLVMVRSVKSTTLAVH